MSSAITPLRVKPSPEPSLALGALAALAALAAVVALGEYGFAASARFATLALAACIAGLGGVAVLAYRHGRARKFGAANCVTLVRAALIAPLIGLLGEAPTAALAWLALAIASVVLVLDGVDGSLARRFRAATAFGARFDMETDALLILVLSALCWQFGKAGAWILAAGLLRYAFVAVSAPLPWLRRALPASRRRQAVCVVQIVALLVCLTPLVAPPWSAAAAALGLAALAWSFLVDMAWLARQR
jgi:phosphatidylglycerophosphate synthase